jgi:hypothetical protein
MKVAIAKMHMNNPVLMLYSINTRRSESVLDTNQDIFSGKMVKDSTFLAPFDFSTAKCRAKLQ